MQDRVVRRNRRVVRQSRSRQIDAGFMFDAAVRSDHVIGEPRLKVSVTVVDVFVRAYVDLAMCIHGGVEPAMESLFATRFECERIKCMHATRVVPRGQ